MFVATRIVNGLVALLVVFTALLLMPTTGSSVIMTIAVALALVGVLYLLDLLFRRKNAKSDWVFASVWTLLFAVGTYVGLRNILLGVQYEIAEPIFFTYGVFLAVFVMPLLLNGIYLLRWFFLKKTTEQAP